MSKQDDYQKGYDAGFQNGYVQGRLSAQSDARERDSHAASSQAPQPDKHTGNGWVALTVDLREQFGLELTEDTEVYVLRDMSGDIIGFVDSR